MTAAATRIGPGRLVLVIGPSGAGKDTLIAGAREACRNDRKIVFPKRWITRNASETEDNETVGVEAFDRMAMNGAFALWWAAHDQRYGIPSSVDDDIRAGWTVVCNVSRTQVRPARERYRHVVAVVVTAPPEILQARLFARRRGSDGDLKQRIARSGAIAPDYEIDLVIDNSGVPEEGIRQLIGVIRNCTQPGR